MQESRAGSETTSMMAEASVARSGSCLAPACKEAHLGLRNATACPGSPANHYLKDEWSSEPEESQGGMLGSGLRWK